MRGTYRTWTNRWSSRTCQGAGRFPRQFSRFSARTYLSHEMERGAKQAGVKKRRVHDLRHSAVSLLINMGFSVLAIGERMGHEAEKIAYRYAHLFPTVQTEMAEKLEMERMTEKKKSTAPVSSVG